MSMSVGGTAGFSNSFPTRSAATTTSQANSPFTPTSASTDSASSAQASGSLPYASFGDGIQVNLPNGISVGVFQLSQPGAQAPASGDSGAYAQMLQSVEQLALVTDASRVFHVAKVGHGRLNDCTRPEDQGRQLAAPLW